MKVLAFSFLLLMFINNCSTSCESDPDEYLNAAQIIRRYGYASESHTIETEDGYLLTLHRIPENRNGVKGGQPVFLQHGLLGSSDDWVTSKNQSLAFVLADLGYDVWLGNARGNVYSRAHTSLLLSNATFWNFSFHEMAIFDLPAAIYHISNTTDKAGDIIYIGHSMGTTMFFVFSSLLPQVAKNIKLMVALAPIAYMTHLKSPIRYLCPFVNDFQWLAKYLGINEFLPNNKIIKYFAFDCELVKIEKEVCEQVIFALCGFDKEQFDQNLLPVVLGHVPAGASTKTILHYAQEIKNDGNFQQYDYGTIGNIIKYGNSTPPLYNLTKIKVPNYLMYGDNDWMASTIDVKRLAQKLTSNVGVYEIPFESFNHVDFLWGKDVFELVYKQLIKIIRKYN